MGMAWYKFYTYVFLPLGAIGYILSLNNISFHFYALYFRSFPYPTIIPRYIYLLIALLIISLNIILVFGLHLKKMWSWYLNLFSLILYPVVSNLYNLHTFSNLPGYICMIILYVGLWIIPNYTYFKRRKVLLS